MSLPILTLRTLGTSAVIAVLAACGRGSQPPLASFGTLQGAARSGFAQPSAGQVNTSGSTTSVTQAQHPDRSAPWMSPGAKSKDLLYVSSFQNDSVIVYSYPQGALVGTLTGFAEPDGVCTDKKGNVWIVNNEDVGGEDAVEYKHGGTSPIATVAEPGEILVGCSVDPTTGNLAVTNIETYGSGAGSVAIFAHAKGDAKLYTVPKMSSPYWCGYDNNGNLFVDGRDASEQTRFAELPKGKTTFTNILLKGPSIIFPGDVVWDGKYVAIGDQQYQRVGSPPEYDSAIFQTTGAGGKIVHTTVLKDTNDVVGFWIQGNTVIAADKSPYSYSAPDNVAFFKYPGGGAASKLLKKGLDQPYGVALSVAPK